MADHGYVYVLINPSMNNLVKIGKTERNPEDRAKELSATTGVPTPFMVAYDHYFESCSDAEKFVHTYLENEGYRVSSNREFFEIPISDAIDAIVKAKEHFGEFEVSTTDIHDDEIFSSEEEDFLDDLNFEEINIKEPWQEMFDIAEDYYYGLNDELVDYDEAMIYYTKAIKLGCISAYRRIGIMYLQGEGVRTDLKKAFKYFKEGAKKDDILCYAEMADLFMDQENIDNTLKSWNKFFTSPLIEDVDDSEFRYKVYKYIYFIKQNNLVLEHKEKISSKKDDVKDISEMITNAGIGDEYEDIYRENHKDFITYVDNNL